jgi:hypothetical protein
MARFFWNFEACIVMAEAEKLIIMSRSLIEEVRELVGWLLGSLRGLEDRVRTLRAAACKMFE